MFGELSALLAKPIMTTDTKGSPGESPGDDDFRMPEIALNSLDDAVLVCNLDSPYTITFANAALARIRGARRRVTNAPFPRSHSPFPGHTEGGPSFVRLFVAPPEKKTWEAVMAEIRGAGRSVMCRLLLRPGDRADPNPVPVDVRMTPVHRPDGQIMQFIAVLRDIRPLLYAEKERADIARNLDCVIAELSTRALHDNMTGLPNRFYFRQKIEGIIVDADRKRKRIGFIVTDLDNFKEVNDTLGHAAGDALLLRVVEAFRRLLRPGEFIVRWGGDEFLWVVPGLEDEAALMARFPELIAAVAAEGRPDPSISGVTASIGHAVYPDDGGSVDDLVSLADYAMYRVKGSGKNGWYKFREIGEGKGRFVPPVAIFRKIAGAVDAGGVCARYTPVRDLVTGGIAALGCRLQWVDAELGEILPEEFIPYVERKGMLNTFVYAMLDRALEELAPMMRERPELRVICDLSLPLLMDPTLESRLVAVCARRRVKPGSLTLRITERKPFLDRPGCRARLDRLKTAGFRFSLAHYASGAMSADTFLRFPFDELQVDGMVVREVANPRGLWILNGVSELSRHIGAEVVLSGIDDGELLKRVVELGFRYGKGKSLGQDLTLSELDPPPPLPGR